jgi:hypothetical protein
VSRTYIPGTPEFEQAMTEFFFRVKARCCEGCLQANDESEEPNLCFVECRAFATAEADEAALLNQDDMLERILFERIMVQKQ